MIVVIAAIGVWAAGTAHGAESRSRASASPAADSFDAFGVLSTRNIFDAERRPYVRSTTRTEEVRAPVDQIAVVGSWINRTSTGTEMLAFFSGSQPKYNTVAKSGDMIGELRIAEIHTHLVRLQSNSLNLIVPIGGGLRKREGGSWEVASALESAPQPSSAPERREPERRESGRRDSRRGDGGRSNSAPAAAPSTSSPATSPATKDTGGGSAADILKRLMERRRQEASK